MVKIRQPEINRVRIKIVNGSFLINLMVYVKLNKDLEMRFIKIATLLVRRLTLSATR
jgi:hypothetical protein